MLGMRYQFHCYMTFQGLELAISCFLLRHPNLFAICYDINQNKYYFRWGGSFLIKWIKMLGKRYEFHSYMTFQWLELAISCF